MSEEVDERTLSIQIANELINMANKGMEDGMRPDIIALGMRHAAANFSAFVAHHVDPEAIDDGRIAEDFSQALQYYARVHAGQEDSPRTSLHNLVDQVKNEF